MSLKLKPLHEQVLFITGATSGIGLALVRQAAQQGAKVFMVSRNEQELRKIHEELSAQNYQSYFAVADVAHFEELKLAADRCLEKFGGIDTWVNNAGISIYSKVLETTEEEAKRLFDVNFWGMVNGCKIAVKHMSSSTGSAIINVGSVLSKVSLPIQGLYSASKHAVKAYTDALRRELMAEKRPISVTLILPSAIDTPYTLHARSHIGGPVMTPPVYEAEVVARWILNCAEKSVREQGVGISAHWMPILDRLFPKIQDKIMSKRYMEDHQRLPEESPPSEHGSAGSLFVPPEREGETEGNYPGHVRKSSASTLLASKSSLLTSGALTIGGMLLLMRRLKIM